MTTIEGKEKIPRTTVIEMETFPKIITIFRGEGVESETAVKFCAASIGKSALKTMKDIHASERNMSDCAAQYDEGDSAKTDDWAKEVDLSEINDATVLEKGYTMVVRYYEMWSAELRRIAETEHMIFLKPGARPTHKIPYSQGFKMSAVKQRIV